MLLPKITIVTPSFNQASYIETTLKTVIEQRYPNLEYFVIDGGSTDETVSILKRYNSQITHWCSEPDKGQSHAIRKGFDLATGEILGWLNSDDVFFPEALHKMGLFFAAHPSVELVLGGIAYANQDGYITKCYEYPKPRDWFTKRGVMAFGQQGMFFRRSLYERMGGIREDFHYLMDTEFLFRVISSKTECATLNQLIGVFRWHGNMKSIQRMGRKAEETRIVAESYGINKNYLNLNRQLFRLWQMINGNYMHSLIQTLALRGKKIEQIWGWKNDVQ